jgi:SEL1 protein
MKYFKQVTRRYWNKDGSVNPNHPMGIDKLASKAAGYVGMMYLRGEGVEQNFNNALTWFKRGLVNGDSLCQHEIGLMYFHGYGVPQDAFKAAAYFKSAADQDFPASETRLGVLFLDQGDVATATRYFELAARWGSMEAFYYLAELSNNGIGRQRHCGMAASYYKMVAERAEAIHSSFAESNAAYENGDKEAALIPAMMAAEQGYESAQANVAFLLDGQRSLLSLDTILPGVKKPRPSLLRNAALALIYWTRSAKQANIDSLIKMGDYYLSGTGIGADPEKASICYHTAAEAHYSAQAYWNLGWMHENGVAVEQDFHMAKRYYDLALEANAEAYLPVKLSLIKLRMRSYWNKITNGKVNSIQEEEGGTRDDLTAYTCLHADRIPQNKSLVGHSKSGLQRLLRTTKRRRPVITHNCTSTRKMKMTCYLRIQTHAILRNAVMTMVTMMTSNSTLMRASWKASLLSPWPSHYLYLYT